MSGGAENFKGKGKDKRFGEPNGNDPTKGGRKPSIKNELKKIALSDGFVEFKKTDVEIFDDKVRIKVPKQDALALKLWQWAMSKKGNDSIKAIQMIMEQIDGKAKQTVDLREIKVGKEADGAIYE